MGTDKNFVNNLKRTPFFNISPKNVNIVKYKIPTLILKSLIIDFKFYDENCRSQEMYCLKLHTARHLI